MIKVLRTFSWRSTLSLLGFFQSTGSTDLERFNCLPSHACSVSLTLCWLSDLHGQPKMSTETTTRRCIYSNMRVSSCRPRRLTFNKLQQALPVGVKTRVSPPSRGKKSNLLTRVRGKQDKKGRSGRWKIKADASSHQRSK